MKIRATKDELKLELLNTKSILITLTDSEDIEQCELLIKELNYEINLDID